MKENQLIQQISNCETVFSEIENLLTVLKNCVENNNETLFLCDIIEVILERLDKYDEEFSNLISLNLNSFGFKQ